MAASASGEKWSSSKKKKRQRQIPAGVKQTCRLQAALDAADVGTASRNSHLASRAYASVTRVGAHREDLATSVYQAVGQTESLPMMETGPIPSYLGDSCADQVCTPPPNQQRPQVRGQISQRLISKVQVAPTML